MKGRAKADTCGQTDRVKTWGVAKKANGRPTPRQMLMRSGKVKKPSTYPRHGQGLFLLGNTKGNVR